MSEEKDPKDLTRTERLEIMQKVGERQKAEQGVGRAVVIDSDESAEDLDYRKTPAEVREDARKEAAEDEAEEKDESEEEQAESGDDDGDDGEPMTADERAREVMRKRMQNSRDDLAAREDAGTDTILPEIDDETGLSEEGKKR